MTACPDRGQLPILGPIQLPIQLPIPDPVLVRVLLSILVPALLSIGAASQVSCARQPEGAGPATAGAEERPGTAEESSAGAAGDRVETLEVRVLAVHPHAADAFTQGLLFDDGFLYESTGQHGRSTLRRVVPEEGEVVARRDLPRTLFGEGLALVPDGAGAGGSRLVQLTWRAGLALVWDLETLERIGEHEYSGEGWGLTYDGELLVMSDGSSWLSYRDPETFTEVRRLQVTMAGRPLSRLNELEWAEGALWANVWGTSSVARIDPASGRVTGLADLSSLYGLLEPDEAAGIDVLNGIAFRPGDGAGDRGVFYVTGKYWPKLFEVSFEEP